MGINFYDFSSLHHPSLLEEIQDTFKKIMEENSFIEGKYNELFEREFANFVGAKYCKLVGNCTDALEMALKVHQIGPGDKVGVPGITFHATAEAVLNVGATPVIIDVDPTTGLIDPKSLERVYLGHSLKAVMPVHIYGLPAPIEELERFCDPKGIKIIEDAAQAIGTQLKNFRVGGGKNLTTFSFYPTKNLGAFGDAGCIITQDETELQHILSLRNHGRSPQGLQIFGRNSRCDHLQAAVLHHKFKEFPAQNERRKLVAEQYIQGLSHLQSEGLEIPGKNFLTTSSWHLFPILVRNQEQKTSMMGHLKQNEVQVMNFYERCVGDERPMQQFSGERNEARAFAQRVLCLPIHPFLKEEEVNHVIQLIGSFY